MSSGTFLRALGLKVAVVGVALLVAIGGWGVYKATLQPAPAEAGGEVVNGTFPIFQILKCFEVEEGDQEDNANGGTMFPSLWQQGGLQGLEIGEIKFVCLNQIFGVPQMSYPNAN